MVGISSTYNLRNVVNLNWKGSANLICPAPLMAIITSVGPVSSFFDSNTIWVSRMRISHTF